MAEGEQIEEVQAEQVETVEVDQEVDTSAQDEAKKYGWKPKEDFDLAPEGWVDADRFLELPSTQLKMQRDANKSIQAELEANRKDFSERLERMDSTNKAVMQMAVEAKEKEYQQQIADLTARQREAVETGDVETWQSIETQKSKMVPPQAPQVPQTSQADLVATHSEKYPWLKDQDAIAYGSAVIEANPDLKVLSRERQLAFVNTRLKEVMPDLVKDDQPQSKVKPVIARTDPGGLGSGLSQQKPLPPEAVAAAKDFIDDPKLPNIKTVDDYAKLYWSHNS